MAYNTTPFHGKLARVEKNDVAVGYSTAWSHTSNVDMADASRQGQSWKEWLPGQGQWSGNMSLMLVLGNTEQKALVDNILTATPGTKLTDMKFLLDASTNAFTGDLYIEGFTSNPSVTGGVLACQFNYRGNGAPTVTDGA